MLSNIRGEKKSLYSWRTYVSAALFNKCWIKTTLQVTDFQCSPELNNKALGIITLCSLQHPQIHKEYMWLIFLNFWHCHRDECSFLSALLDFTIKMKPSLINSSIKQTLNSFLGPLKFLFLKTKSPQRFWKLCDQNKSPTEWQKSYILQFLVCCSSDCTWYHTALPLLS